MGTKDRQVTNHQLIISWQKMAKEIKLEEHAWMLGWEVQWALVFLCLWIQRSHTFFHILLSGSREHSSGISLVTHAHTVTWELPWLAIDSRPVSFSNDTSFETYSYISLSATAHVLHAAEQLSVTQLYPMGREPLSHSSCFTISFSPSASFIIMSNTFYWRSLQTSSSISWKVRY